MKKRNEGFTLIELMVTILVASIVMAAATSVLLMYMRMQRETKAVSDRVNNTRVVMYVLESLAAKEHVQVTPNTEYAENAEPVSWEVKNEEGKTIFGYNYGSTPEEQFVYSGSTASPLIEDVKAWAYLEDNLLTMTVVTDGEPYSTTVYCRLEPVPAETQPTEVLPQTPAAPASFFSDELTTSDITPNYLAAQHVDGRQAFLAVLMAEEGSTGKSRTTGEYFSEWYIGSYENNPDWSPETPWCACYISWALDRCSEYLLDVPRYAHVDRFMDYFDAAHWRSLTPHPGDIIFFDWIVNDESIPQHVGVVLTVEDDTIYTIEGNTEGKVAVRSYAKDDPRILGCGVLNWK